ncbi:MAG: hypothetical protein JSS77_05750 [Acidobacteria bacterium]|nr:hypothetical protein [Acidobacteriota bacterium]
MIIEKKQQIRRGLLCLLASIFVGGGLITTAMGLDGGYRNAVFVSNVEELYTAVNDPNNAGKTVVVAPGTYVLSAADADGTARPNGGRLELQENMSLTGRVFSRSGVTIDTSGLPASSLNAPGVNNTAPIRIGRGENSVERLAIIGNPAAQASIETDLVGVNIARIRVAHVTAHGSKRGVDVRSIGAVMSNRVIFAELIDNEFWDGFEGIRFVNTNGVNAGYITGTMTGNYVHDNENGCLVENAKANFSWISVRSVGDLSQGNGAGCILGAALATAGSANNNTTIFEAYGSRFIDNNGPFTFDRGGIVAFGAETPGLSFGGSNNRLVVRLWNCQLSGNQNSDLEAWGARAVGVPEGSVGTNNRTTIELQGSTRSVDRVVGENSLPVEPAGTNSVTILR